MPPRIDSLSNHQVSGGQHIRAYGSGFDNVAGVQVGTEWAANVHADGGVIVSFELPEQAGGSTNWVVVHLEDGSCSPCEGDAQLVTYDSILEPPAGELRVDSLVPETVALGREDTYWVLGSGLSKASGATLGNHAAIYETHDDTRLMLTIPALEQTGQDFLDLTVWAGSQTAVLSVPCSAPEPWEPPYSGPVITSMHPESLPADGGELTIEGTDLDGVTTVCIGSDITTPPYWVEKHKLVVTVPSLAAHVGEQLGVEVIDATSSSGTGSSHRLTVTG